MIGQMLMAGTVAAAGAGDPLWELTRLCLNGTLVDATGRHSIVKFDGTDAVINANGINLDGATSYEVLGNPGDFRPNTNGGAYTAELIFKGPQGAGSPAARILMSCYDGGNWGSWEIFGRGSNNGYGGGIYQNGGAYIESASPQWVDDQEHHVALVYDPGPNYTYLYFDGARIGSYQYGHNGSETFSRMFLSRESVDSTKYWLGNIKLVRYTNAVRYTGTTYEVPAWPVPTS